MIHKFHKLISVILLGLLANMVHATGVQVTLSGTTFVNGGSSTLIADQLSHYIKNRCGSEANTDSTAQVNSRIGGPNLLLSAKFDSNGVACTFNFDIKVEVDNVRMQVFGDFKYHDDYTKVTGGDSLSSFLKALNGYYPTALSITIPNTATLNIQIAPGVQRPGCPTSKRSLSNNGFDYTITCQ
ncbi:hypothetical protein HDU97_003011 [Phlyctochytrium planicorne]|nr:hypothetical protein HDU97_003011 [Phlyctochytrium planicorne]